MNHRRRQRYHGAANKPSIPYPADEAEKDIEDTKRRLRLTRDRFRSQRETQGIYTERLTRDLMDMVTTSDRWIVAYGAGLAFVAIDGVGFVEQVSIEYRTTVALLTMISLIVLGLTKILTREAIAGARAANEDLEVAQLRLLEAIDEMESELGMLVYTTPENKRDHARMTDSRLKEEIQKLSKVGNSGGLEKTMRLTPIIKYRLDLWSLGVLAAGSFILVIGVVHCVFRVALFSSF